MSYQSAFQLAWLSVAPLIAQPIFVDQGEKWGAEQRKDFYSRDQGSRIMPLSWMLALKQPNGQPFLADSLSRYGYLPNPKSSPEGLPVGFTVASLGDDQVIGMTCSACHTREIQVDGKQYRIDGGPGIVDFQRFLVDLDSGVQSVLASQAALDEFANSVLGPNPAASEKAALRKLVAAWQFPFHKLITASLPKDLWGVGRLDAVSMIFNRLTGLDIGPPPTYVIEKNIKAADAPVRYPFLWNATIQDMTQWPGFSKNGNDILGLGRNVGEVYGVFAVFRPKKRPLLAIDYLSGNTTNFQGLGAIEDMIKLIGPPKWPWSIEQSLVDRGRAIFAQDMPGGSCSSCHGIKKGAFRGPFIETWLTPVVDVGTDSREHQIIGRKVETGTLNGARTLHVGPLAPVDTAFNVLVVAVTNTILQHSLLFELPITSAAVPRSAPPSGKQAEITSSLDGAYSLTQDPVDKKYPYESRVLQGIWAAAPYLHNGSVRSLADLLKPAAQRAETFLMGPEYDIVNVGIAESQPKFSSTLRTTDCSQRDSGNSRCGHEFGTQLSDEDKRALLEYLKTL